MDIILRAFFVLMLSTLTDLIYGFHGFFSQNTGLVKKVKGYLVLPPFRFDQIGLRSYDRSERFICYYTPDLLKRDKETHYAIREYNNRNILSSPLSDFLEMELEMSQADIIKVGRRAPNLFSTSKSTRFYRDIDEDIERLFLLLETLDDELDISPPEFGKMIAKHKSILYLNPERLSTLVDYYLSTLGVPLTQLRKMCLTKPQLLLRPEEKLKETVVFYTQDLGLTKEEFLKLLAAEPLLLTTNTEHRAQENFELLMGKLQITKSQAVLMVRKNPGILTRNWDENLLPKIEFLEAALGCTEKEISQVFRSCPSLLSRSAGGFIKKVDFLHKGLGFDMTEIKSLIIRQPSFLTLSLEDNLLAKLRYFMEEIGLTIEEVKVMILQASILNASLENKLRPIAAFLSEIFGYNPLEVRRIFLRYTRVVTMSLEENIKPTAEMIQIRFGLLPTEWGRNVLLKQPSLMSISLGKLNAKIAFFQQERGLSDSQIKEIFLTNPTVFTRSLEGCLHPRHKLLQQLGIEMDIKKFVSSTTRLSEKKWLEMLQKTWQKAIIEYFKSKEVIFSEDSQKEIILELEKMLGEKKNVST